MSKKLALEDIIETLLMIAKAGIINSAIPQNQRVGLDAENLTIWGSDLSPVNIYVEQRKIKCQFKQTKSVYQITPKNKGYFVSIRTVSGLPTEKQLAILENLFKDDEIFEKLREDQAFVRIPEIKYLEQTKIKIPQINYNPKNAFLDVELNEALLKRATEEYMQLKEGMRKITDCETINDLGYSFYNYILRRTFLAFVNIEEYVHRHKELPRNRKKHNKCHEF